MNDLVWTEEFPGAVTVCDRNGVILSMNERSIKTFASEGGADLIGKNLLSCHPESARSRLAELLEKGERNVYTIEKNGIKKLIYQSPWYKNGEYSGLVELSLEIPETVPHFIRK